MMNDREKIKKKGRFYAVDLHDRHQSYNYTFEEIDGVDEDAYFPVKEVSVDVVVDRNGTISYEGHMWGENREDFSEDKAFANKKDACVRALGDLRESKSYIENQHELLMRDFDEIEKKLIEEM